MSYVKNPKKYLRQSFAEMGAEVHSRDKFGARWRFPDNYVVYISDTLHPNRVMSLIGEMNQRYGVKKYPSKMGVRQQGAPRLDMERLTASEHSKGRLRLMNEQAGLDIREVLFVLKCPQKVLWQARHQSWCWVGERVALPMSFDDTGHATIRTIIWTTDELWEENPRPTYQ